MIAFRRLAPLPLLLIALAVFGALLLTPEVQAQSRDSGSDFTLGAANGYPTGIWSDGTTMWVADFEDDKLYAYRMSDRSRDSGRDFTLDAANGSPVGIWSDGTTMWASDFSDGKLYAYRMSDRSRDSGKDFNTLSAAGNKFPEGIWSDGTTMWVADTGNDTVFAYDLSTRAWGLREGHYAGPRPRLSDGRLVERIHDVGFGLAGRQAVRLPDVGPELGTPAKTSRWTPTMNLTRASGRPGPPCGSRPATTISSTHMTGTILPWERRR